MASKHLAVLCFCLLIAGAFARSEPVEDVQVHVDDQVQAVKADIHLPVFVEAKASSLVPLLAVLAKLRFCELGGGGLARFHCYPGS